MDTVKWLERTPGVAVVDVADVADVAEVIRAHGPFVWRVLRQHGVDESLLEDACQEVFLVVLRKLAGFEGRSELRTWLYAIAANVARRAQRLQRSDREVLDPSKLEATSEPVQLMRAESRELERLLERALADLNEKQRSVFVLFEIEGVPMTEIAAIVGCRLSTAYSRLARARDHVARVFARATAEPVLPLVPSVAGNQR